MLYKDPIRVGLLTNVQANRRKTLFLRCDEDVERLLTRIVRMFTICDKLKERGWLDDQESIAETEAIVKDTMDLLCYIGTDLVINNYRKETDTTLTEQVRNRLAQKGIDFPY